MNVQIMREAFLDTAIERLGYPPEANSAVWRTLGRFKIADEAPQFSNETADIAEAFISGLPVEHEKRDNVIPFPARP